MSNPLSTQTPPQAVLSDGGDAERVASDWLHRFASAASDGDADAIVRLFLPDGWWRDMLALTWDLRTLHGAEQIRGILDSSLPSTGLSVDERSVNSATVVPQPVGDPIAQAFFDFETKVGRGRGVVRLVHLGAGEWQAFSLFTALHELRGHEEATGRRRPKGVEHGARQGRVIWKDRRHREREFLDADPRVLVIGAGQSGLALAARLRALDVETLVIERNERVGDNWRNRYPALVLHDPVGYDHLPYLPFPETWPVFTPKDKLADWFEAYAAAMDLNVWTATELTSATYDDAERRWTVALRRGDGSVRQLRPAHVVLATGASGEANVPEFPGIESFRGEVVHSSTHTGGAPWAGKNAVVIGACNSGLDVAQDFYEAGAQVTVVQRSGTYVMSSEHGISQLFGGVYDEDGPPTDDADMLFSATPLPVLALAMAGTTATLRERDADMLAGLEAVGFRVDYGDDGSGLLMKYMRRGGGYYIDVGCAALIADGRVAVAQGREVERFEPAGPVLSDGTLLEADIVVLATGYANMRETARRMLGDEVSDRCSPVWGVDDEGELRGVWRPSGHPGTWFMAGNLALSRFFSLRLALQIKAREVGLVA